MKVSIIIPVFNCEKYLADCIESCMTQDIPRSEYEVICVNDCSADKSDAILAEYEKKYSNLRVIRHVANFGVSAARNTGLKNLLGEYCWFLDGDDFIADNCLGEIIQRLQSGCDILSIGQATFQNELNRERHYFLDKIRYNGTSLAGYITSRIIRTSLLKGISFQTNVAYGEDEIVYFEVMRQKPNVELYDRPIYYYRLHSESAMSLNDRKKLRRIASVENSMVYMAEKYTYKDIDVAKFIDQRVAIAIGDIATLNLHYRCREIYKLVKVISDIDIGISREEIVRYYLGIRKERIYQDLRNRKVLRTAYRIIKRRK